MNTCAAAAGYHQFMTPNVRRNRFWEAIRINKHKVFPLWPGGCYNTTPNYRDIFDQNVDDDSILYLDEREADVAFPTGMINGTTVIEVTSAAAQDVMDELDVEQGAQIWTPRARYYLFDYIKPTDLQSSECVVQGLRLMNDGDWIHYPGNWMDGFLVHWEHDPWAVGTYPLPRAFWDQLNPRA